MKKITIFLKKLKVFAFLAIFCFSLGVNAQDAKLLSIDAPMSGHQMSNESITFSYANISPDLIEPDSIEFAYILNGAPAVVEAGTDAVAPGDTSVFTFATQGDFSAIGMHTLQVYYTLNGDVNQTNDTIETTIWNLGTVDLSAGDFTEDFELGYSNYALFSVNDPENAQTFIDLIGNDTYGLTLAGNNNNVTWTGGMTTTTFDNAYNDNNAYHAMATFSVDATTVSDGLLVLDLEILQNYYFGYKYEYFWVLVNGDSIPNSDGDYYRNPPNSSPGDISFTTLRYDLSAYEGTIFEVTLVNCGKYAACFAEIDNIFIGNASPYDAEFLSIDAPMSGLQMSNESITFSYANIGPNLIESDSIEFAYILNGAPAVVETGTDAVAPGDTAVFTFATQGDFSAIGMHTLQVYYTLNGDTDQTNDTIETTIWNIGTVDLSAGDFTEDFESGYSNYALYSVNDPENAQTFIDSIGNDTYGLTLAGNNNTGSWTGYGSSTTFDNAYNDNTAYHAMASFSVDASTVSDGLLIIDLDILQNYYYGNKYEYFWVLVNGDTIPNSDGDYYRNPPNSSPGDVSFTTLRYDLSAYEGTTFEVTLVNCGKYAGCFAEIDNIFIGNASPYDAKLLSIDAPMSGHQMSNESITFSYVNNGPNLIEPDSIEFAYILNGAPAVIEAGTDSVAPGDTSVFTFATQGDFSAIGMQTLQVFYTLNGDTDQANDTIETTIWNLDAVDLSGGNFTEDFESGYSNYALFSVNDPENAQTFIDLIGNDTYGLTLAGNNNTVSWSGYGSSTTFDQAYNNNTAFHAMASFSVDASTVSDGLLILDLDILQNYYLGNKYEYFWVLVNGDSIPNSDGDYYRNPPNSSPGDVSFTTLRYDLSAYEGTTFEVTLVNCGKYAGCFAEIDNIFIGNVSPYDAELLSIDAPMDNFQMSNESITFSYANIGRNLIEPDSIEFAYILDGAPAVVEAGTDSVALDESSVFTFATQGDFSAIGMHTLQVYYTINGDTDQTNDTIETTIWNLGAIDLSGGDFTEDFELGYSNYALYSVNDPENAQTFIDVIGNDTYGLTLAGNKNTGSWSGYGTNTTFDNAYNDNTAFHAMASFSVDASAVSDGLLVLDLDILQNYFSGYKYEYFWVLVNGDSIPNTDGDYYRNPANSSPGDDSFTTLRYDLSAYKGTTFEVTLVNCGKYEGCFAEIDNIVISNERSYDAELLSIDAPMDNFQMSNESITFSYVNIGNSLIKPDSIEFAYILNGASAVIEAGTDSVAPGDTSVFTFATQGDFSAIGIHTLQVYCTLNGDVDQTNDTIETTIENYYDPIDDAELLSIDAPMSDYQLSNESITFTYVNIGDNLIEPDSIEFAYILNGASAVIETGTDSVAPGDTSVFTFATQGDFSAIGMHTLQVYYTLNGDVNQTNDTIETTIENYQRIYDAELLSIDAPISDYQISNESITFTYVNIGNSLIEPDSIEFAYILNGASAVIEAGTDAVAPGDTSVFTFATQGDFSSFGIHTLQVYYTLNGDVNQTNDTIETTIENYQLIYDAELLSIDAPSSGSQMSNESITFTYVNFGPNLIEPDSIEFAYILNGASAVIEAGTDSVAPGDTSVFTFATQGDFSAIGTHTLQVYCTLNGDVDQTNDTIETTIENYELIYDAELLSIDAPMSGNQMSNESITFTYVNFGDVLIEPDSIEFAYILNGAPAVIEAGIDSVAPGDTAVFTFATQGDFSAIGMHTLQVYYTLNADTNQTNDTIVTTIEHYPNPTPPIEDDFNDGNDYLSLQAGIDATIVLDPTEGVDGTQCIKMAGGAGTNWPVGATTYTEAFTYTDNIASASITVDATTVAPGDALKLMFDMRQETAYYLSYSWLRVLVDGSVITNTNGEFAFNPESQYYDPYEMQTFDLSAYSGSTFDIVLQAANKTYWSCVFIDNLSIRVVPSEDLEAVKIYSNMTPVQVAGEETMFNFVVKNMGNVAQSDYLLEIFEEGNPTPIADTLIVGNTIEPLGTDTIPIHWTPAVEGALNIRGVVTHPNDPINTNDTTDYININVFSSEISVVTLGDQSELHMEYPDPPFDLFWETSLTETMYYPTEITTNGHITGVNFYGNFVEDISNVSVKVWLGETDLSDLSAGFISANELTEVFDGTVSFTNTGDQAVYIEFDQPYLYTGDNNLVMMCSRPMDITYSPDNQWYYTNTPGYPSRTVASMSHDDVLDPFNPPVPFSTKAEHPDVSFFIITESLGSLDGVVDDGTATVESALVHIIGDTTGFENTMMTDAAGYYMFGYLPQDTYTIITTASGFLPDTTLAVIVLEGDTTTQNITLIPEEVIVAPYDLVVDVAYPIPFGEAEFTWSWSASTKNHDKAQTGFNVYLDDLVTPVAYNITDSTYTFTDLTPNQSYTAGVATVYTSGVSDVVTVDFTARPDGIFELNMNALNIYPVPANDVINISSVSNIDQVKVMNVLGEVVFNSTVNGNELQINTSHFENGVYMMQIHIQDKITMRKIQIMK